MSDVLKSGFFDLQVNGYGGVDFNTDDLTAEGLHQACQRLADDGVAGILATIVTEHLPAMVERIKRLTALRQADPSARQIIAGLHIEGPFLNPEPGFRGAHPADALVPADPSAMGALLDAGAGLVRLVTLAPECDQGLRVTRLLRRQGIVVAAGHTNVSRDQLAAAADAGLTLFTHLGNGCPKMMPRHDNIIQWALSLSNRLRFTFIADGVHVPLFALRNYLRCAGLERCMIVTDAMAAAGMGPGRYRIGRWNLEVGEDLAAWAPDKSHLVGSAGTMRRSAENLAGKLGLSKEDCQRLLIDNAKQVVGI